MTEILQGMDPAIVLVNTATSILDPAGAAGMEADLAAADGPGGLVAGRDKAGAAGRSAMLCLACAERVLLCRGTAARMAGRGSRHR